MVDLKGACGISGAAPPLLERLQDHEIAWLKSYAQVFRLYLFMPHDELMHPAAVQVQP